MKPGAATQLDAASLEAIAGDVPCVTLPRAVVVDAPVVDVMAAAGLQPSKSAARRLVAGGGVYLNNVKVRSPWQAPTCCGPRLRSRTGAADHAFIRARGR